MRFKSEMAYLTKKRIWRLVHNQRITLPLDKQKLWQMKYLEYVVHGIGQLKDHICIL
jgi:hypothetical protein